MVGHRVGHLLVALAIAACGSSEHSPTHGGEGGIGGRSDGVAGSAVEGGSAGASSHEGGAAGTGSNEGGSAGAAAGSGGALSVAGNGTLGGTAGTSGSGLPPKCTLKDDDSAPFVGLDRTSEPAPVASGGPVPNGTYFLTKLTYHGGTHVDGSTCLPILFREVLRFSVASDLKATMHSTLRTKYEDGSGDSTTATEATYQAQDSSITGEYICSVTGTYKLAYTTTDKQLQVVSSTFDPPCDKGVVLVSTYEKQP